MLSNREDILVAATTEVHHHQMVLRFLGCEFQNLGKSMGGFERRNDAFELGTQLKGIERFGIGRRKIIHAADIVEPSILLAEGEQ